MAYYNKRGYTRQEYHQAQKMIDRLASERWAASGENQPDYRSAEATVRSWMGKRP
jgi:hypothetical protein